MTFNLVRTLCAWLALAGMTGCATLPAPLPSPPTHAIDEVSATTLGRIATASAASSSTARSDSHDVLSGFRLLPDADFSLDARIALARNAEKSLDVQYYLLQDDAVGLRLLRELRDAARRGVRVRLLIDDLYSGDQDALFGALAELPGIEVRSFNPLPARGGGVFPRLLRSLHEFERVNHRMHNKLFVADNSVSVSGGRNMAAEYFMRSQTANFIDVDVLASGPIVRAQSQAFDTYWNSEQVWPIAQYGSKQPESNRVSAAEVERRFEALSEKALAPFEPPAFDARGRTSITAQVAAGVLELRWARGEVLYDDPTKITRKNFDSRFAGSVTERTLMQIKSAQSTVVIVSPYFIPGEIGLEIMKEAAAQGVTTTVLTNSLGATDEPLVYAGYARYRAAMLKLGVVIYEVGPTIARRSRALGDFGSSTGSLHAKLAVIDGRRLFIGSMNLDGRSASLNTEIGLLIDSPELVADFNHLIQADRYTSSYLLRLSPSGDVQWVEQREDDMQVIHLDEPNANWLTTFKNWLLSPFVREELL